MNAFLSQNRKYVKLKNREHANRIVWLILQYLQLMTVILNNDINVLKKSREKNSGKSRALTSIARRKH